MDIQQTDKESLATYVHRFKREANKCKFDNDTATIRIFLKGLKNVHTIATKVYEKGPQTLLEAIKEVEKLQTAQQITSTLLPASLINTMSSNNDRCFQCQEVGHMACYCPHIWCYDCDNYGHVAMDCPDKIPPSGTPAHHQMNNTERSRRSSSRHPSHTRHSCHDQRDRSRFSHSRSRPHDYRYRSNSRHDHCRNHSSSFHRSSRHSSSCNRNSSSHCYHRDTPHSRPSSHCNISQDNSRSQHSIRQCQYKPNRGSLAATQASSHKYEDRKQKHRQVTIDDPLSEYYSSDESETDSKDDLN